MRWRRSLTREQKGRMGAEGLQDVAGHPSEASRGATRTAIAAALGIAESAIESRELV